MKIYSLHYTSLFNQKNCSYLSLKRVFLFSASESLEDVENLFMEGTDEGFMANGLHSDFNYYFLRCTNLYTIGHYRMQGHPIFSNKNILLFSEAYHSLIDRSAPSGWIDGDLILLFFLIHQSEYENVTLIPPGHSQYIFQANAPMRNKEWEMYNLPDNLKGKLLLPICLQNHWTLYVVDIDNGLLYHIDPYHDDQPISNRTKLIHKYFQKYLDDSRNIRPNKLHTIKWKQIRFVTTSRPFQTDAYNCGIFVMYFIDCIGRGESFDENFNPDAYRDVVSQLLINESEAMNEICAFCFRNANGETVTCTQCQRFAHRHCLNFCTDPIIPQVASDARDYVCHLCSNYYYH